MKQQKVILNIHVANKLLLKGFPIVEVKPSNKLRGRSAFIFDNTPEFNEELRKITNERLERQK